MNSGCRRRPGAGAGRGRGLTAAATKRAYRSDWDRFPPLPAPPAVLAHYVTEAAAEQTGIGTWRYAPATLTRWVASINQVHTAAGLDPPGRNEVARAPLVGNAVTRLGL